MAVLTKERLKVLKELEKKLKVRFKDRSLLNLALTHISYSNERKEFLVNNERLEFLGDSVLALVLNEHIYKRYPFSPEGDLAKMKSFLVSSEVLARIGQRLEMGQYLLLGKGEEATHGRKKLSLVANAVEAIIGAVYMDQGLAKSRTFVMQELSGEIREVTHSQYKDFKTKLQEVMQRRFRCAPRYRVLKETGPAHRRTFEVGVQHKGNILGSGTGASKKEAEQAAAKEALTALER
ncbi:MAG: ribonuclease III [Armatimonadetes bacterium]|nr:ribonuclease III [Armatimonadota bacterium]